MKKPISTKTEFELARTPAPAKLRPALASSRFVGLHKYLDDRYASTVVLTFAQIEDLLGFALPDDARLQQNWWADRDENGKASPQSGTWTAASRTATPNLIAQTVMFERPPS